MSAKHEDMAEIIYLQSPVSKAIFRSLGNSQTALSQVISKTGYPRVKMATWLLDMVTRGLKCHSIKPPNDRAEAVLSLSPKGRTLLSPVVPAQAYDESTARSLTFAEGAGSLVQ